MLDTPESAPERSYHELARAFRRKHRDRAEIPGLNLASGAGSVGSNGVVNDTIGDFNGAPGLGPGEPFNMQLAGKIIF